MLNEIKERVNVFKWWYFVPVIGPIVYVFMVDALINKSEKETRTKIKKYKSIYDLSGFLIAIPLLVLTFTIDWDFRPSGMPVVFWIGVSWGIFNNITPLISQGFYKLGIKKYEDGIKEMKSVEKN